MKFYSTIIVFMSLMVSSTVIAQERTVSACAIDAPPANCSSNMWALEINQQVPNGAYVHVADPGCMNDATEGVEKVIQSVINAKNPLVANFSGSLSKFVASPINNYLRNQGGDIGRLLSPYAKNGAICAPVIAKIPSNATYLGYRLIRCDGVEGCGRCSPGADCRWSKFQSAPVVQSRPGGIKTVTSIFMNWSHDRPRTARMIVFYTMPQGETPGTEM